MTANTYPMPQQQLKGANCSDLPPHLIDKYFFGRYSDNPVADMFARKMCERCVIREQCLQDALVAPNLPQIGVLGGHRTHEIIKARSWLSYELGFRETAPYNERPDWLPPRSEAAETIEQALMEQELGVER